MPVDTNRTLAASGTRARTASASSTSAAVGAPNESPRVVVHEQLSARLLTAEHVPEALDLIVCDASFISLEKVLDVPLGFARSGARLMALIKPQFEAERHEVGKKGVVRDASVHARVCAAVAAWLESRDWSVEGVVESPITGPEGNIEFLIAAHRQ